MYLKKGSTGQDVLYLQYGLHIMCYRVGAFDGIFGDQVYNAVISYQSANGLAVDGIVGDATWNKLKSQIAPIQTQLNAKGFNVGAVDGIAGSVTYNQVLAFQRANGLVADGMVGTNTRALLFGTTPPPPPPPSKNKKIFIDPGHGGYDPGAVGNGLQEKNITLSISLMIANILKNNGYTVSLSRTTDVFVDLSYRATMANNYGADLFVSIHCNSASSVSATGTECFSHPTASSSTKQLSANISRAIANKFSIPNRGAKEANFAVLRLTSMPANLVETAFISNANDAVLLRDRQDDFAQVIATEIMNYFQ